MTPDAASLVNLARKYIGRRYVLGVLVPKDDAAWMEPFDCSEFAAWLVYQTTQTLFGCNPKQTNPAVANAHSSWFAKQAEETGAVIPIEVASGLPGALLVRKPAAGATGHVVVCTGDGGTIEAKGSKYGVVAGRVDGRRWDLGIRIPSLHYSESARARPVAAPTASLSVGSSGGLVLQLQRALLERGYQPGLLDGEFGTRTAAALMAFQRAEGEVVDGEAGPETLAALGIQP